MIAPNDPIYTNPPGLLKSAKISRRRVVRTNRGPIKRFNGSLMTIPDDTLIVEDVETSNNLTNEQARELSAKPYGRNYRLIDVWPKVTVERDNDGVWSYTPWVSKSQALQMTRYGSDDVYAIGNDKKVLTEVLDPQGVWIVPGCNLPFGFKFRGPLQYLKHLCGFAQVGFQQVRRYAYADDDAEDYTKLRFLEEKKPVPQQLSAESESYLAMMFAGAAEAQAHQERFVMPEPFKKSWVKD